MTKYYDTWDGDEFVPVRKDRTPCADCGKRSRARTDLCEECQAKADYKAELARLRSIEPGVEIVCYDRYNKPHFGVAMSTVHDSKVEARPGDMVTVALAGVPRMIEWPAKKIEVLEDADGPE